jgi:DNA-binding transcriptional LysR family regulator
MLQLPHLETFSKAAELGSFTGAAKALHLTQAAVSQRIHALEKAVGKSLFQRQGGHVLVTASGQKLYDYAQRILELHRTARREVAGQESPLGGELLLAASSIPGEHLLPTLLAKYRKQYSHIQVRASVSDSMTVLAQVERGEVSLGLVGRKMDNPHLEYRFLARDRMVLIAPPRHPLSRRKKVSIKDVIRYPLVLREPGSGLRHCFEKSLQRAEASVADLQIALELGSNEAIKEAVLRGLGLTILSIYAVQKEIAAKKLRALPIADLRCDREMYLVWDRRRVMPFPARAFLTLVETTSKGTK